MESGQPAGYILVVDDTDAVRDMLCDALSLAGHAVRGVRLAAQALDAVADAPPTVILLDLVMPPGEMSGIEALFALRRSKAAAHIPVIVISGIADLVDAETMQHLNVYATVPKPVSARALTNHVSRLLADLAHVPAGYPSREPRPRS